MNLDMFPSYLFWLGMENVILLVCDIYALLAINPGVEPSKMFLIDAKLTSLPHLTLVNT